jgi:LPS-assembly lipoprotein
MMAPDVCRWVGRRSLMAVVAIGLAGCGFHPVYESRRAGDRGAQAVLGTVDVALIPDRAGQLVRQELQARLDRGEGLTKKYELTVGFGLTADAVGIQQDSSVTRVRMVGTANWSLRSLDPTRSLVTTGLARSVDGLNILDEQYFEADLAGETSTRRIAAALADQITLQLSSYFSRVAAKG